MYKREIRLKDNEIPAKVNLETGEITELKPLRKGNKFATYLDVNTPFNKNFPEGWKYLTDVLSPTQIKIAMIMSHMAKQFTNSIAPLDDSLSLRDLEDLFGVSKSKVKKDLEVLFKHGVYGKFEVYDDKVKHSKHWVFNPYLSYNGKTIHKSTETLFSNTTIAKIVRG